MRLAASLILVVAGHAAAGTVAVVADRDATLIEDPDGAAASGAGPLLFVGRTNFTDNGVRRGLVRFDLAGTLPPGGAHVLEGVTVVLTNLISANTTPREFRLHRVLAGWGEGASASAGGGGAPAQPGDATWIHAFYSDAFWLHNGGQFDGEPSARLIVAGPGVYRFEDPKLDRDVALWAANPELNFGWMLIGDETVRQTARAFGSRENPEPGARPVLEVTFRGPARFYGHAFPEAAISGSREPD